MLILVGKCPLCNEDNILDLSDDVGEKALSWLTSERTRRGMGGYIQDALPELTPDQREAFITGAHGACFDLAFAEDDGCPND